MPDVNIGELAATTLRRRRTEVQDAAINHNLLLTVLQAKGKIVKDYDGRKITCPLVYDGNGTFQRYNGWQQLNINDGKVVDAAEYDPVQYAVNFSISGREEAMNRGKSAAVKLVEAKMKAAKATFKNNMNVDLLSDGSLSNQIGGMQLLIADDPTVSATIGGINQSTNVWWRNQVTSFAAAGFNQSTEFKKGLNNLWAKCTNGAEHPDLIIMDENYYTLFEAGEQELQRYTDADTASKGFKTLKYKGCTVGMEKQASGMPANHAYFINTDYLELSVYKGRFMETLDGLEDGLRPLDQDGYVFPMYFMGQLTTDNRKRHGVLKA